MNGLFRRTRCSSRLRRLFVRSAWAALALAGAGCQILPEAQPDPTRYFLLSAPTTNPGGPTDSEAVTSGATLGLRPIELPAYLRNTKSLVVARGTNELTYRDYDRWAEPLEFGVGRVLRDALAAAPNVRRVLTFPFGVEHARDFDLTVRITQCEGAELDGGRRVVRFALVYEISRAGAGGELVRRGAYAAPEVAWDGEASSLAARLGDAAAAAGRAIAAELP